MIHYSPNLEQRVPFDPDFDEADHAAIGKPGNDSRVGHSSRQAFVAGLISAVLILGTLGFIVLIVKLISS